MDVSAVGAAEDETVGVELAADAAVTVGVTFVVADAAVCAVDAVSVVDVHAAAAAALLTSPGDAAFVANQQVNQSDFLGQVPVSSAHAAAPVALSGVRNAAVQGQAVSNDAVDDIDGVFVALAAVSCRGFLPGAGWIELQHAVGDPEAGGARPAGSAQEALENRNAHLWV